MAVARREAVSASPHSRSRLSSVAGSKQKSGGLVRGLYVLLAAASVLEVAYPTQLFPDDIGQHFPFFQDFATWTHIKGLSFSLAELYMLGLLVLLLFKALSDRTFRFDRGSLVRPLGLYALMLPVAEVYGLATGGDSKLSLWELRPQVYMIVAYILACNLVKTRKQIHTLVWILVAGAGLKAIQGVYRYRVELHGNVHTVEALFPHEQSFFFNVFLTLAPILFLYGGTRRMKILVLSLLPFVLIASLANQRRAAILAIVIGVVGLLLVTAILHPPRRRVVIAIVIALAVIWPPYYAAFKNSSGLLGEVAHAVASSSNPDPRDASSNLYRVNEDADIVATVKSSTIHTIIGYGFGKPMLVPYPLPGINTVSATYVFWNIMPHNSILWVWMRLGTIGYVLLWFLIGIAIKQALEVARRLKDPYLKGLAVWIALIIVQQIIFGYLDLQWVNYRNMITLGVLFALISRLAALARDNEADVADVVTPPDRRSIWPRRDIPRDLAVIDGRLVRQARR